MTEFAACPFCGAVLTAAHAAAVADPAQPEFCPYSVASRSVSTPVRGDGPLPGGAVSGSAPPALTVTGAPNRR